MSGSPPPVGGAVSGLNSPETPALAAETRDPAARLQRTTIREWIAVLAASASPLLLLLGSRDWLLTPIIDIDPWTYVALFDHYAEPGYLSDHYKLARLPWVISGWIVHRLASGVTAAYLLHGIFMVAGGCAIFVLLRALFGRFRLALLGAMFTAFYLPSHGSGGWDYHNTAAGPIYLWALAAVTLAAISGGWWRALLAGVVAALAVHSNITYGAFVPVLAAHYLFVYRSVADRFPSWRLIAAAAMWGTIGAVGVTVLLSAINVMVGREAIFFARLLDFTVRYTRDTRLLAGWWLPWKSGWFWHSPHLGLAVAMLLLSPLLISASPESRPVTRRRERLIAAEFLIMAAVWTAWQFAGNLTVQWNYFFYPLQPHVILALMALANARLTTIPTWALVATPVLLLLPLALNITPVGVLGPLVVLPTACFLCAAAALWTPPALRVVAFAGLCAFGNAWLLNGIDDYSALGRCHDGPEAYSTIVAVNQFVAEQDPALINTRLWFDESEVSATRNGCPLTIAQIGYSLAGTGVPYLVNPFPMPPPENIPDDLLRLLGSIKSKIAIVSMSPRSVSEFERRVLDTDAEEPSMVSRQFRIGDARFDVTILQLRDAAGSPRRIAAQRAKSEAWLRLPGATVADWSREQLATLLGVNTYAVPPRRVLQHGAGGRLLFVPATPDDHLATAFAPIPASTDPRALLIATAPDGGDDVNCTASIQDQALRVLATVPCGTPSASMVDSIVPLTPDVTAVRVFFLSPTQSTMVLPSRLRISYHHGAAAP